MSGEVRSLFLKRCDFDRFEVRSKKPHWKHAVYPHTTMTTLPGYHLGENLYQGTRTLVYRGTRTTDSQAVIIKLLRNEYPTFAELAQFRNQYAITKNLNLPGIVQPLALENYGNGYALVMPSQGYISLGQWQQGPLNLGDFLSIAVQLAQILHQLDRHRVIHKDIKPANILIHPQTKHVQLIDFSISSRLPKETQEISSPNTLEGTLAYISPEQTGRMNRGIDYRSDFYSLGVTFYELLTGELPFHSDDPMELVHCHLARFPVPPDMRKHEIPQMLSDMVLKLMAKNAEDRYQSALGLKYDLEKCLRQWKETGNIEGFELGKRDICDRFIIPEKLYGREAEVERLLAAFDRVASPSENRVAEGNTEMMLVTGFSGIGKTAVINEIHKPITRQQGYFIQGKFDQFNRNVPLSAFVQAFRSLMKQLLGESDAALAIWKAKILDAVGVNGQVLIEVIPELEAIIDAQPAVPELSGSAAQNRFNLLFGKFARVFATPEHPLAIFLDDLQWADLASLNLLKLLVSELALGYLFVLGAYRDNEVFAAHPLMLTLDEIDPQSLQTLTLAPLQASDITRLVADTLLCSPELAAPLSHLVYQKTQGNPFFTTQFLQGLYEEGCIVFDGAVGCWQCDLACVRQLALTDDVVEFMMGRLRKLSESTQTVLKLAACIGNRFNLETLAVVCESHPEEVAADLWPALREGLVIPESETYKFFQGEPLEDGDGNDICVGYRFLHDRVQQAAYTLIPDDRKQRTHYQIGQLLLQKTSPEAIEDRIFELINQLNYGTTLISEQNERDELAQLNLLACRKAKSAIAYQAGREYASTGLFLLSTNAWERNYEMSLAFHEFAAEFASLCGDIQEMENLFDIAIAKTKSLLDRVPIYLIIIKSKSSQNKLNESISIAQSFLREFGVTFSKQPTSDDIHNSLSEMWNLMNDRDIEDLVNLPIMTDNHNQAIIQIANSVMAAACISGSPLFPLLNLLSISRSIQYGNTLYSAFAYACYGIISCNFCQDVSTGVKFSQLALAVASKLKCKEIEPEVFTVVGLFLLHRKYHIKETLPLLREGYLTGLEVGNLEFSGRNAYTFCINAFFCSQSLTDLEKETRAYANSLKLLNQFAACNYCQMAWQLNLNFLGSGLNSITLSGEAIEESSFLPQLVEAHDLFGLYFFYFYKLILCYLFNEIELAKINAIEVEKFLIAGAGTVAEPAFYFYDSLTALAELISPVNPSSVALERVSENQKKLQQDWSHYAPVNHQHKIYLVEAEKYRVLGQTTEAIEYYDRAIAGAKANEYLQEEALANELAAKFYLDWGKDKIAQTYMVEAYYCYARWGAKAKTDHLEATYPQLLTPILQQPKSPFGANATSTLTSHPTLHSSTKTTTSILDLTSAIKASQTLSGEIELEALLSKLTHIVLENAGADKGALILQNTGTWEVAAFCEGGRCHLCLSSLDGADTLPMSIVRTVQRTQQTIVLNRVEKDAHFSRDVYLKQQQPKSLCCTPILNQGRLIGILYLENNLSEEAFTQDRLEVLNLLCSQAAISLENARLYENAQAANKMLQKSLEDLKQAQLQIVQSEKMSALGNLVAGVAHEINNPVGFIGGNLQPARDYIQDLFGLIDLYREKYPDGDEEIEEEIEAIDLDFLREDLPKLMGSMKLGVERIAHISKSLRTFSRTDQEHKVPFNIHDGIDSTLLILKHRLKANEQRPKIGIIKHYGNIPEIRCFPGQLNQVFMNLIANAIDALDESNEGRSFEEIAAHPNRITIQTQIHKEQVIIQISDNGVGIPDRVKARIFEQGFTTKGVGKGTGLGMAIARQIIEEKHGGTIACSSTPGKGTEFAIALSILG